MNITNIKMYSDGASRGNPGKSGAGTLLINSNTGEIIKKLTKYLGYKTNNQAEYAAVYIGIYYIKNKYPNAHLTCYMDSKLVANQLSGNYKIKQPHLRTIATEIINLTSAFTYPPKFIHIPRAQNTQADQLANLAIDQISYSH